MFVRLFLLPEHEQMTVSHLKGSLLRDTGCCWSKTYKDVCNNWNNTPQMVKFPITTAQPRLKQVRRESLIGLSGKPRNVTPRMCPGLSSDLTDFFREQATELELSKKNTIKNTEKDDGVSEFDWKQVVMLKIS